MAAKELERYVDISVKILSTHGGRDRVAKFFHYLPRVLRWLLLKRSTKTAKEMADEVEKFRLAIGSSRRVGRFFSFINSVPGILTLLRKGSKTKESSKAMRYLLLIASVSDALYYFSDNLTFAAKYNFIKLSPQANYFWEELVGSWTWLISVLIYILNDVRTYLRLVARRRNLLEEAREERSTGEFRPRGPMILNSRGGGDNKKEMVEVNEELFNVRIGLIRNLADLQLAIFFCFPNSSWPSQWVGVFGMINALLGIYHLGRSHYRQAAK